MTFYSEPQRGPVTEAHMERDEHGAQIPGAGWFVLNVADAAWFRDDFSSGTRFHGDAHGFGQYGFNVDVLRPGVPSTRYHREFWEDESFLVISGECIVLVEGEERPLTAGDLFHSPAGTAHGFVGAGDGPCAMITVGARNARPEGSDHPAVIYEHDPVAAKYGACVTEDTSDGDVAYAGVSDPVQVDAAWVPGA